MKLNDGTQNLILSIWNLFLFLYLEYIYIYEDGDAVCYWIGILILVASVVQIYTWYKLRCLLEDAVKINPRKVKDIDYTNKSDYNKHPFTCPRCGGHWFGSYKNQQIVYCNTKNSNGKRCGFEGNFSEHVKS